MALNSLGEDILKLLSSDDDDSGVTSSEYILKPACIYSMCIDSLTKD